MEFDYLHDSWQYSFPRMAYLTMCHYVYEFCHGYVRSMFTGNSATLLKFKDFEQDSTFQQG